MSGDNAIHISINNVMADVGIVEKTGENKHFGFQYQTIGDIKAQVQTAMIKHGITPVPTVLEKSYQQNDGLIRCELTVQYRFYGPGGDYIDSTVCGEGVDKGAFSTSKAMTSAYKEVLKQVFCIPTDEADPDSAGPSTPTPPRKPKTEPKPEPKPPSDELILECAQLVEFLSIEAQDHWQAWKGQNPGYGKTEANCKKALKILQELTKDTTRGV